MEVCEKMTYPNSDVFPLSLGRRSLSFSISIAQQLLFHSLLALLLQKKNWKFNCFLIVADCRCRVQPVSQSEMEFCFTIAGDPPMISSLVAALPAV